MTAQRGVSVHWHPFSRPPFSMAGWPTPLLTIYPAKGAYMWRETQTDRQRFAKTPASRTGGHLRGAPFHLCGRDLFRGHDRLESAIDHATGCMIVSRSTRMKPARPGV